ncbi:S8 family peptidase [Streptomyces roseoverticillatus]|uniref:S8 family serine peptidase n=1 Tax=Streptomyces roseoverticillatus TaxID=66429 RepID=A0ABV3IML8_9ACTN
MTRPQNGDLSSLKQPFFNRNDDARVPGEAIVKLTPEATSQIREHIPDISIADSIGARCLGIAEVDLTLQEIGVRSISHLHSPSPPVWNGQGWVEPDTTFYYAVRFDPKRQADAIALLSHTTGIVLAESNYWREGAAANPSRTQEAPEQWGLERIGCPAAWKYTEGDPDVVIAVIDSGVDLHHRALYQQLASGRNFVAFDKFPTVPHGLRLSGNYTNPTTPPWDEHGHGTHVAGKISCARVRGSSPTGVTLNCTILPVRAFARAHDWRNNQPTSWGDDKAITAGIDWAVTHGARIINMSFSNIAPLSEAQKNAIDYAIRSDVVVITSAGNGGDGWPMQPAATPGVIAVGATDSNNQPANFSSRGDHVKIWAPGVDIWSTHWGRSTYASMPGTSIAAAHVSGVAALLFSLKLNLTASDVRRLLLETTTPITSGSADPDITGGLVNAEKALRKAAE